MRTVPPLAIRWTGPDLKGPVTAITGVRIFAFRVSAMRPMGSLVHRRSASQTESRLEEY